MKNRVEIIDVKEREIYNRAGKKVVECDVCTIQGQFRAAVSFYRGKKEEQIKQAKTTISRFHSALLGKHPFKQADIDKLLKIYNSSSTERRTILAISMAICRAGAMAKHRSLRAHLRALAKMEKLKGEKPLTLPIPVISLLNTYNALPFKEFDIIPIGAKNVAEALEIGSKIYAEIENKIREKLPRSNVAKHAKTGAMFVSHDVCTEVKDLLKLLELVVKDLGLEEKVVIHISVNANRLYEAKSKMYNVGKYDEDSHQEEKNTEKMLTHAEFLEFVLSIVKEFPMVRSLSDPLATQDWKKITKQLGETCKIGRSIFELQAFQKGCEENWVNHACVSVRHSIRNQDIYTVTDLISLVMSAKKQRKTITFDGAILTENDFLTDLVVALNLEVFKAGWMDGYNQLLRIEEELGPKGKIATLFETEGRF